MGDFVITQVTAGFELRKWTSNDTKEASPRPLPRSGRPDHNATSIENKRKPEPDILF